MSTSELDLVRRAKAGDENAFGALFRQYQDAMYRVAYQFTGSADAAADVTQDTFVKVYFKGHTLRGENLKSWIFTIATNLARSHFRRHRLGQVFSLDDVGEKHAAVEYNIEAGPLLETMLNRLPEKYRVPLVMREIDNFSFAEIAEMMKKPVGTIKTLVFRGKRQLQEALKPRQGGMDNGTL